MPGVKTYDRIGIGYDETRRADPRIAADLARHLAATPAGRYLDVGCGTGNYTVDLGRQGLTLVGLDQSATMLRAAGAKWDRVRWCLGDAGALPFAPASFDGALCTLAIHHFPDLRAAFGEIGRVLVAGGRFVVFTAFAEQMTAYWLNEYFPVALERSIEQMPTADAIRGALRAADMRLVGIEPWEIPPDPVDLFLYSGKHRPALYLDPAVRRGISTFALLANPDEVSRGLERLAHDIDCGRIDQVRARYTSHVGDYAFVIAER